MKGQNQRKREKRETEIKGDEKEHDTERQGEAQKEDGEWNQKVGHEDYTHSHCSHSLPGVSQFYVLSSS